MENDNILTKDMREHLKSMLSKELSQIPEILNQLEPKDKLNYIIKLLPFALPKVESIDMTHNEPDIW